MFGPQHSLLPLGLGGDSADLADLADFADLAHLTYLAHFALVQHRSVVLGQYLDCLLATSTQLLDEFVDGADPLLDLLVRLRTENYSALLLVPQLLSLRPLLCHLPLRDSGSVRVVSVPRFVVRYRSVACADLDYLTV